MGTFLRSLSTLLGGPTDGPREHALPTPPSPELVRATPVEPEPVSSNEAVEPGASPLDERDLPLVAYAAPRDAMTLARPRRSRSIGLLRNVPGNAITTRTLPTLPSVTTRPPTHPSAPLLTETERIRLQVMQAQIKLSLLHLYEGPIDGHMSPATATAVRYFQTLKGMRPTGTLAAGTLAALGVPAVG